MRLVTGRLSTSRCGSPDMWDPLAAVSMASSDVPASMRTSHGSRP